MTEALLEREEVEPQTDSERASFPLHAVVYEARPKQFSDRLRASKNTFRPIEPIEPEPYSLNELDWRRYEKQRDAARVYAAENDLRGTF